MKKTFPFVVFVFISLSARAEPFVPIPNKPQFCKNVLQGFAFNDYLESKCAFGGEAAILGKLLYYGVGCKKEFSQEIHNSLKNEAVLDGEVRFVTYGKKEFCRANKRGAEEAVDVVSDLLDKYYPSGDKLTDEQKRKRFEEMQDLLDEMTS